MATKLENLDLEIKHFNNFIDSIPGIERCCRNTIDHLLKLGIIQVSTAFEHALANMKGTTVVSYDSNDLGNGADAKISTVRTSGYGKIYSAQVSNIKGKTGNLLVQVYERKKDRFYYFDIPYNSYKDIPPASNIEIPFHSNGIPKRIPSRPVRVNWWNYEIPSFRSNLNEETS